MGKKKDEEPKYVYYAECPLCGYESPVKVSKKKLPYFMCKSCGTTLFVNLRPEYLLKICIRRPVDKVPDKFWQPDEELLMQEVLQSQKPYAKALGVFWQFIEEVNPSNPTAIRKRFVEIISSLSPSELNDEHILKRILFEVEAEINREEEQLREEINELKKSISQLAELAQTKQKEERERVIKLLEQTLKGEGHGELGSGTGKTSD